MEATNHKFTIALIYDFDGTLAAGNMQEYDFIPAVGKSNFEFWDESNRLAEEQDADQILTYMALMIHEAHAKGLSLRREAFQESGKRVELYPGVLEWFDRINAIWFCDLRGQPFKYLSPLRLEQQVSDSCSWYCP